MEEYLAFRCLSSYIFNLDPGSGDLPYRPHFDIRDVEDYKRYLKYSYLLNIILISSSAGENDARVESFDHFVESVNWTAALELSGIIAEDREYVSHTTSDNKVT